MEYFTLIISPECIYMLPTQKNIQTLKHLPQTFNVPLMFIFHVNKVHFHYNQ